MSPVPKDSCHKDFVGCFNMMGLYQGRLGLGGGFAKRPCEGITSGAL